MDAADQPDLLVPLLTDLLPPRGRILSAVPSVARAVARALPDAVVGPEGTVGPDPVDAVLLLSGEVAEAGEAGPAVVDAAVRRARPGGLVAAAARSATHGRLTGTASGPAIGAGRLAHAVEERGMTVRRLCAPGAAAGLAGRPWAGVADLDLDSTPGLLDAGPVVLVVGRTPPTPSARSAAFFASITRRIVAASALVTAPDGRVLVVHDTFKGSWTLPGGLVDAGESPLEGAVRECREEGGVQVQAGDLLGLFAHRRPDRVHVVYAAVPVGDVPADPVPLHPHEISAVRWATLPEALDLVDAGMARKITACTETPGRTWSW